MLETVLSHLNYSDLFPSFLSLLVSKQQPTRKLCYFGCCTLIQKLCICIISSVILFSALIFFFFYLNSVKKVVVAETNQNLRVFLYLKYER